MPGGSAWAGVCIAVGVRAEGGCERRKENGVHGGAKCVMGGSGVSGGTSGCQVEGLICMAVEI
jgi:hypothetical protein